MLELFGRALVLDIGRFISRDLWLNILFPDYGNSTDVFEFERVKSRMTEKVLRCFQWMASVPDSLERGTSKVGRDSVEPDFVPGDDSEAILGLVRTLAPPGSQRFLPASEPVRSTENSAQPTFNPASCAVRPWRPGC